jgi:hypothetical protein
MVLHYYKKKVTPAQIKRFVLKDPQGATVLTELGRFATHCGLSAECLAYNLFYTEPADAALSPSRLYKKLKGQLAHLKEAWYQVALESTLKAFDAGVRYRIKKPALADIRDYLTQGIPPILTVNYAALHEVQGDPFEGHDIVITGNKDNHFFFIDPKHGKEEDIAASDLLFAWLQRKIIAAGAYLLAIGPRK